MSRAAQRFRFISWCALAALLLGPVVADAHFASSSHRWCQVHERIEEAPQGAPGHRVPRAPGWSEDRSTPCQHDACPVLSAQTPATRASLTALRSVTSVPLAAVTPPDLTLPSRSVLDVAPKQGPPVAA